MTGKTHQALGIAVGLGYFLAVSQPQYGPATLGAVLVGAHLSALMPDLDQPAADIWNQLPFGNAAGQIIDPFLKHRNISHSLLGLAIFGIIIFWLTILIPDYWGIDRAMLLAVCLVAYASHLIADTLTVEGVPWLFPYKKMIGFPPFPFEGFRIMTGKWFENLVLFPLIDLAFIIIIVANWEKLKAILFK